MPSDIVAEIRRLERLRAERGDTIGYLIWHTERGSVGPPWSTAERAAKFLDTCTGEMSRARGDLYKVVVVSELPAVQP